MFVTLRKIFHLLLLEGRTKLYWLVFAIFIPPTEGHACKGVDEWSSKVEIVKKQIEKYEERFGVKPPSMTGDQLYGNRENRAMLKEQAVRSAFKPLGRKSEESLRQEQYVKRKQRERNRIEGDIGNVKEHYGGHGIRYHYREGSEQWVRLGFLAKNLKTAMVRIG